MGLRCSVSALVSVFGCCLWRTVGFSWGCLERNAWFTSGWFLRRVWVLPVRGDATGRNSWFDIGYMFCVSFERFFDEFHTFSMLRRTRILQYLSPFSRRKFTVFFTLWKSGHHFNDDPWLTVGVTILGIFAAFLQHLFGLFFGIEPPGQCTGTGPCIICLSDFHRRGAFVVMHTPSRKPESETTTIQLGGSVFTGEEPPPHSGELKHAVSQETSFVKPLEKKKQKKRKTLNKR